MPGLKTMNEADLINRLDRIESLLAKLVGMPDSSPKYSSGNNDLINMVRTGNREGAIALAKLKSRQDTIEKKNRKTASRGR